MTSLSPFLWRRRIGMRDVDTWGVVWYGNYLVFCDEARAELLRAFDLAPSTFQERGFIAPVVEVKTRHHAPARFDEEIDVHVRLRNARGSILPFHFEIRRTQGNELLARIETKLVLVTNAGALMYTVPPDIKASITRLEAAQPEGMP